MDGWMDGGREGHRGRVICQDPRHDGNFAVYSVSNRFSKTLKHHFADSIQKVTIYYS